MNTEPEQIFLLNPSDNQSSPDQQKLVDLSGTAQVNLENVQDFSNVCRICATVTEFIIPIFSAEGVQNNLADKIHKHLPIQVSEQDPLPRVVCYQCASTLLAWHELVQCCAHADAALRTRLPLLPPCLKEDQLTIVEAGQSTEDTEQQNKSHTKQTFTKTVNNVLRDYFTMLNLETEDMDVEFVCQLCSHRPALTNVETLADHLMGEHHEGTKDGIGKFIQEHITFEETLSLDNSDRDHETEDNKPDTVLPNYLCPFCENMFSSGTRLIYHLNKHMEVSLDDGVPCCQVIYNDKRAFVQHLQADHVSRVITDNVCRTCGYVTEHVDDLHKHIHDTHENKAENRPAKKHSSKNQKYIPAVCPECNRTFSNKYNMFAHMKSHSGGAASYPCDKCDKTYRNKGNLSSHRKQVHEGILDYPCASCGEAFPSRCARDTHARRHSGRAPFVCSRCGKAFRAKNTLDRHMDFHLDIRKYECHVCTKRFRKRTHLNYHLTTHRK